MEFWKLHDDSPKKFDQKSRDGNASVFLCTEMYDHDDPTAWQAIANVERERKRKQKPKPKEKPVREPLPPVDWRKLLKSEHKKICVNRAWLFYSRLEKNLNELRSKG